MPSDRYAAIYRSQAAAYDRLVAAEDCDDHLLPALRAAAPLAGKRVLEIGAGTGRLTRLLLRAGASRVFASEASTAMLAVARDRLRADLARAPLFAADAFALPVRDRCADLAAAGWVLGHQVAWWPDQFTARIRAALAALERVVRPSGHLLILETLGTGSDVPGAPNEGLAAYYALLESMGFQRSVVQTDYSFTSVDEAAEICGAFFGEPMAARIRERRWARVPEWTGLWVRR